MTRAAGVALAVALALAVLAAACDGDDAPDATPTAAPPTAVASPTSTSEPTTIAPSPTAAASSPTPQAIPTATPLPPEATVVYRGTSGRRSVALTFDAGADRGFAGEILATLREKNVRASFGMTGVWGERNTDLLLAIAADGHTFINHSYDHRSFTGRSTETAPLTLAERNLQLSRTETTVFRLTSRTTRPYFRPPFGDIDASVERDAAAAGYPVIVMWSIDTLGWNRASADAIVQRTLDLVEPGAIIIMHVGAESQDAAALPRVIDELRARGYAFETIDELLVP